MAEIKGALTINGLDSLDAALRALPEEVAGPVMSDALVAAGEVVRKAAAANIHSRSGQTAADLRVEVQVNPGKAEGAAAIGGTRRGKGGRAHILRWLEFGAKAHEIKPHRPSDRTVRRTIRTLANLDAAAAVRFARGLAQGTIRRSKGALAWSGTRHPVKSVKHPGMRPQSPLTLALLEHSDQVLATLTARLRQGIIAVASRFNRAA